MTVVGVDFLESVLTGTGEMESIGSAEEDVAGVEIAHELSRSRSSDMISVESWPPRSAPLFMRFLNAGLSLRRGEEGGGCSGAPGALGSPFACFHTSHFTLLAPAP